MQDVITTSASIGKIIPALLAAKKEMGPLYKGSVNPAFRSKYANLEAVLDVVEPCLEKHGLLLMQCPSAGEEGSVALETRVWHTSGEWLASTLALRPAKPNDPQAAGSTITYMRRYAAQGLFSLAAEDDDGNKGSERPKEGSASRNTPRGNQAAPGANAAPESPHDPNAMLLRAVDLGLIPEPDRLMFKEYVRSRIPSCKNVSDNARFTREQLDAIAEHLELAEETA